MFWRIFITCIVMAYLYESKMIDTIGLVILTIIGIILAVLEYLAESE